MTSWATKFGTNPITKLTKDSYLWNGISDGNPDSGVGKVGVVTKYADTYLVASNGDDTNGNGALLCPFETLTGTLDYIISNEFISNNAASPLLITLMSNIDDTGKTTNFPANVVIDLNGFTWKHGVVLKSGSWTKADYNNSILTIKNGRIIPAESGTVTWDIDFISEEDIAIDITLENIYTTDRNLKPVDTWAFRFSDDNDDNAQIFIENCKLDDLDGGGNNSLEFYGSIYIDFEGGISASKVLGQSFVNGNQYININGLQIINTNTFFLDGSNLYVSNLANIWNQYNWVTLLGGAIGQAVEFDASLYNINTLIFGQCVSAAVKSDGGTGYTNATVVFSSPDLQYGRMATGTANMVGGVVVSVTITDYGSGYITPPSCDIVGDGDGAIYIANTNAGASNNWMPRCSDTVILPTYNPTNYTPVPVTLNGATGSLNLLKSHLNGIDVELGNLAASPLYPPRYFSGGELSFTGFTTVQAQLVDCLDSTGTYNISVGAGRSCDISTNGPGGLDTGSAAVATNYAIYTIAKSDGSQQELVASLSFSAPDLSDPSFAGFDKFRYFGRTRTETASTNLCPFYCLGSGNTRIYFLTTSDPAKTVLTNGSASTTSIVDCSAWSSPYLTAIGFEYTFNPGINITNQANLLSQNLADSFWVFQTNLASTAVVGSTDLMPIDTPNSARINYYLSDGVSTGRSLSLNVNMFQESI